MMKKTPLFSNTTPRSKLFALLFGLLFTTNLLNAQAGNSFEAPTGAELNLGLCEYFDLNDETGHILQIYEDSPCSTVVVSEETVGTKIGFTTFFQPNDEPLGDGFVNGEAFGIASITAVQSELGIFPPDGLQAFLMSDIDGFVKMNFDPVDLTGTTNPQFSLEFFINATSWELEDSIRISIIISDCTEATTIDLLNTKDQIIDGNYPEESWELYELDLTPYIDCKSELEIMFSSNTNSESVGIDNIVFTEGNLEQPPVCDGGTFYDSGGPYGNYSENENLIQTICPDNPGDILTLSFTEIAVEGGLEVLHIYNGSTSEPTSALTPPSGLSNAPASFTSTAANGCLTITFASNDSNELAGWVANTSCEPGAAAFSITCPPDDATLSCGQELPPGATMLEATGACDGGGGLLEQTAVFVTFTDVTTQGDCSGDPAYSSMVTRTYTGTDICGNTATCAQVFLYEEDTTPPVITCPADLTLSCGDSTNPESTSGTGISTVTNTDGLAWASMSTGLIGELGAYIVTLEGATVTDINVSIDLDHFNISELELTLTSPDGTVVTFMDNITTCGSGDNISATFDDQATSFICSEVSNDNEGAQSCANLYLNGAAISGTVQPPSSSFTAFNGLLAEGTWILGITDTEQFLGGCLVNYSIEVAWEGGEVEGPVQSGTGVATATDACDAAPAVDYVDAVEGGSCTSESMITRTWTATDACGNSTTCNQVITIEDTTPPSIFCPADVTISCGTSSDPSATGMATASDNCDSAPVVSYSDIMVVSDASCNFNVVTTRRWIATDACGNSSFCDQTITEEDSTPPSVSCPADVTISCGASSLPSATGMATATDNCDSDPFITFSDVVASGSCDFESVITRTWTASDICNNSSTCVQTIVVVDNTPPVLSCPPSMTVECNISLIPEEIGMASATDNCDANPVISFTDVSVPGDCPQESVLTRTWTATDLCGNSSTCNQVFTITDLSPPIIEIFPQGVYLECDAPTDPESVGMAWAFDYCDSNPVISYTESTASGSCPQASTITRIWTATDACNNSASLEQLIFINDSNPPSISCPADVEVECNTSTDPSVTGMATVIDNCDVAPIVSFSDALVGGACTLESVLTRTWTATDACGNSSSCVQTITIKDSTPPTISCPLDTAIPCNASSDPSNTGMASATDNCDSDPFITFSDVLEAGSCTQESVITRTWTATDICNNSSTCVQTIVVVDDTPPIVICSAQNSPIECGTTPVFVSPTISDNCDANPVVTFNDTTESYGCGLNSNITRTWIVTDACGNLTTCSATITTIDVTPPIIVCPADITLECNAVTDPEGAGSASVFDECDSNPILFFTDAINPGTCSQSSVITRTWIATDACGNSSSCNQTITVIDPTPPSISCPLDIEVECNTSTDPSVTGMATVIDNCDAAPIVSFSDALVGGACTLESVLTRTWTATDECGNSSSCVQTITIKDSTPPMIFCPSDVFLDCGESAEPGIGGAVGPNATATDNCDNSPVITYEDVLNPLTIGYSISRTWTATDACGNASTCLQIITVEECEVAIEDPCVCVNNASVIDLDTGLGGGDGQFSELVSITGPNGGPVNNPNLFFEVIAISGAVDAFAAAPIPPAQTPGVLVPVGTQLVYNPATMHYELPFYHYDGVGYSITVQQIIGGAPGQILGPIGNNCVYPDPIFNPVLESLYCPNGAAVTLGGIDQNGVGADDVTFTINGSPATEFDPSSLDKGFYTIVMTFDGAEDGNGGISPDGGTTPVQPGCIQEVMQTVEVNDVEAPIISCPADVNLVCTDSTDPTDIGEATATDNCDTAPVITFADVSTQDAEGCGQFNYSITRTWTATDACDNSTTCVQTINVADNTAPVVTCPADQTLTCFETIPAPVNTAAGFIAAGGTITDDCTIDFTNFTVFAQNEDNGGDNCPGNARTIVRTYFVSDLCGNTTSCEQTFTYEESTQGPVITSVLPSCYKYCASLANPMESDITFETDCNFGATVNIDGPVFIGQENCPGSIIRYTYTVTDDCGRTSAPVTRDFIIGNDGPTIECPAFNLLLECGDPNNSDYIAAHAGLVTANSACDADVTISYFPQNFNNITCNTSTVVTFVATDACGRTASCTTTVNISDNTPPVITSVYEDGVCNEAVCGSDLNFWYNAWKDKVMEGLSATDVCDTNVSISPQGPNTPSQNCPDETTETVVNFVATDNCGNTSYIPYSFYVTANDTPEPPQANSISGMIHTEEMEAVEDVEVYLSGGASFFEMFVTGNDGMYEFNNVPLEQNYTIAPLHNEFPMNGVSSYDIVLISKHILGIQMLDSPYKVIAADINRSGSVTTLDLVELRKMILFINTEFSNNTSWRFVDADFVFPNAENPFASVFPEVININGLLASVEHDFVGVKTGDVNGTAVPNTLVGADDRSFNGILPFKVEDVQMKAGETYEIAFSSSEFKSIAGYQYTLNFNEDWLEFVSVNASELAGMSENNFGLNLLSEGVITTSWTNDTPVSMKADAELFRITFKAKRATKLSEALSINSRYTVAEAYDVQTENGQLNLLDVTLRFEDATGVSAPFALLQNTPNPFRDETVIGFVLPEATKATLTIFDVSGKQLKLITGDYEAGYNELTLDRGDLAEGILYYKLETATNAATKKMLLLD